MQKIRLLPWILFFLALAPMARAEPAQTLGVGEQTSLAVDPGTRFSAGNSQVIQVKATQQGGRSLLLIKGKSQGYSDLILLGGAGGQRSLAFRVVSKRQAAVGKDGASLLAPVEGLRLQSNGAGWLARGQVKSLDDWNAVEALEEQGRGQVQSLAKLHPLERAKAESQIRRRLRDADLAGIEVKSAGNTVLLYGEAESAGEKALAESLAREVFRGVISQVRVPIEKGGRLRFRARILEVLKNGGLSLGLQWPEGIPNALEISPGFSKANLALDAALRLMEKRGQARLLSQPELLLNEKGVAELRVGGEIPIALHSRFFSAVQWKEYGLSLRLELPGVSKRLARTHVIVDITTLDPANGADGVPALRVSRMDTQVDMQLGKAVLLSGLMENRESRNITGIPLLGDLPVIGELFRSHDFQSNRSELVILLEATS